MSINRDARKRVRERANFACEYCEVSESDSGGELTIDHYQPKSKNGSDDETNLVYCCFRCNTYKSDYWHETDSDIPPPVWNPRIDRRNKHFWLSESGVLFALTEIGELTIRLLSLNRQPLVTKRRDNYQQAEERRLLEQSQKAVKLLVRLSQQQLELLKEQQNLLEEQRQLLNLLINE